MKKSFSVKRAVAGVGAATLAGLMVYGASNILAYLTDEETASNTFTVGKVQIDVEEPNYPGNDSNEVKQVVPNEPIPKDPQINNTGENVSASFMAVDSPVAMISIVGDDGRLFTNGSADPSTWTAQTDFFVKKNSKWLKLGKLGQLEEVLESAEKPAGTVEVNPLDRKQALQEVFSYSYQNADGFNGTDWVQVTGNNAEGEVISAVYIDAEGNVLGPVTGFQGDASAIAAIRRVFAYNKLLAPHEKTNPVFDQVVMNNVVEGDIDSSIQHMNVTGYGIQAAYLKDQNGANILDFDEDDNPTGEGIEIDAAKAAAIYNDYIGQNGDALLGTNGDNNNANNLPGADRLSEEMYLRTEISVDDTELNVGEFANASKVIQTNYDDVTYAFASSDESVATINAETGRIEAKKPGTTTISVTATKIPSVWTCAGTEYPSEAAAKKAQKAGAEAVKNTAAGNDTEKQQAYDDYITNNPIAGPVNSASATPITSTSQVEVTVKSAVNVDVPADKASVSIAAPDGTTATVQTTASAQGVTGGDAATISYDVKTSNEAVATAAVSSTGKVTITRKGSGSAVITVTATVDGVADTATITVNCPTT